MTIQQLAERHIHHQVDKQIAREEEQQSDVANALHEACYVASTEEDPIEVMQWYTVSWEFYEFAKNAGEVVAETPFGPVWGRQTCFQDISLDHIIGEFFNRKSK